VTYFGNWCTGWRSDRASMANSVRPSTSRVFLKQLICFVLASVLAGAASLQPKLLIVVAHPDDEYMFAATTFRLVRELGWIADQVVITNGESGYRYASLAQSIYGKKLDGDSQGRSSLPAIRKEEVLRAAKILGTRKHYFLDQKDLGFTTIAADAGIGNWDRPKIVRFLSGLLAREHYDAVFTLLPTSETHGHHRAATILALEAVSTLNEQERPLVFGAEADSIQEGTQRFSGLPTVPLTATVTDRPAILFDRNASFGYHNALNYQIVVNWVIAEHKSQGLFQTDAGKHEFERLWLFQVSGKDALLRADRLRVALVSNPNRIAPR
jgi:N-acetylglucosamine malate deacetylase 2